MKISDYVDVFETCQIGRLFFLVHKGSCISFHIFVLELGVEVNTNYPPPNSVQVFGITRRSRGGDVYGWLHDGPWQEDMEREYTKRAAKKMAVEKAWDKERTEKLLEDARKDASVLASY